MYKVGRRSAWIETPPQRTPIKDACVSKTRLGVRGLKLHHSAPLLNHPPSHSARSAWIETGQRQYGRPERHVALRKECVD